MTSARLFLAGIILVCISGANADAADQVLYAFQGQFTGPDGAFPYSGSLAIDQAGNLYGTTQGGGDFGQGLSLN